MGKAYDGKKRWNETILRTTAAASATPKRAKKTQRFSGNVSHPFPPRFSSYAPALPHPLRRYCDCHG